MTEEERVALAMCLLNDTLGMDDVPKFIIDRVSVAVILLDPYESDDIDMAIAEASSALEMTPAMCR